MTSAYYPFVLGGAQLGMKYGIANKSDKPTSADAFEILSCAENSGVTLVDTAKAYGESEKLISEFLKNHPSKLQIISKFHSENDHFEESCQERFTLFGNKIFGILFHNADALKNSSLGGKIFLAKQKYGINHFGVSVYSFDEFQEALKTDWVTMIQAPYNAWDWKLYREGLFQTAAKQNKIVMLRSLLLQGALTLSVPEITTKIPDAVNYAVQWEKLCHDLNKEKYNAAQEFVFSSASECGFVIGCDDLNQLKSNLRIFQHRDNKVFQYISSKMMFTDVPDSVTKPFLWKKSPS